MKMQKLGMMGVVFIANANIVKKKSCRILKAIGLHFKGEYYSECNPNVGGKVIIRTDKVLDVIIREVE